MANDSTKRIGDSMHEVFNILERHGIAVAQDLLKVGTLPAKKIEKLHQDLFDHIYDEQNKRIWGESSPAADMIQRRLD